jgi:hypothetical protein
VASTEIHFFATRGDLEEIITAVEAVRQLAYVRTGLFDEPTVELVETLLAIPEIGTAQVGDGIGCPSFLVATRPFVPAVRSVPQRRGGTKYAIDQRENPETIVIRPGGVLSDTVVIAGSLGTVSEDPASLELFALFRTKVRSRFSPIKSYRVGPRAAGILDAGGRLTANVRSPVLYDLTRN